MVLVNLDPTVHRTSLVPENQDPMEHKTKTVLVNPDPTARKTKTVLVNPDPTARKARIVPRIKTAMAQENLNRQARRVITAQLGPHPLIQPELMGRENPRQLSPRGSMDLVNLNRPSHQTPMVLEVVQAIQEPATINHKHR